MGCSVRLPSLHSGSCVKISTEEVSRILQELEDKNRKAKQEALVTKAQVLQVKALTKGKLITFDSEDPYPKSEPFHLTPPAGSPFILGKYLEFHGWAGAETYYETESGSRQYFIVDEVLFGGETDTRHHWHVSSKNELFRALFRPKGVRQDPTAVCGCAPGSYESEEMEKTTQSGADLASPVYAPFLLPGTEIPIVRDAFEVLFEEELQPFEFIPRDGKTCILYPSPVC